jgi:DNA mismatch repair protein MutS
MTYDVIYQYSPTHFVAIQSLTFLLDFVYQHSPNLVRKITEPVFENHTDKLILANHSLKQLNMLDDTRYKGRLRSVGTLLNNCVTNMGKRQFNYNLNNPTTNVVELNRSYDITEYLVNGDVWQPYRENMSGLKDMEKFMRKLVFKKTTPKNLALLAQDLNVISTMYETMSRDVVLSKYMETEMNKFRNIHTRSINELCKSIINDLTHNFSLEKCVLIDDMSIDKLSSISNDTLSFINKGIEGSETIDHLFSATVDSREKLEAIQKELCVIISSAEKASASAANALVKIHETAKSDPILIGTKRRMVLLQNQLKNRGKTLKIMYSSSYSGAVESFDFRLDDLEFSFNGSNKKDMMVSNKQIKDISVSIQSSKDKLLTAISGFYLTYIDGFLSNYNISIEIISHFVNVMDVLQCKSYIAHKYNYCKPIIKDSKKSYMNFTGIRHPLIEHLQTKELYVTNDLEIGDSFDGLLLYGTNAVGKTSFIKSVGIAVVMAQAGLFVPCIQFEYCPYKCIFTRILGNDNIFKGLSTFAVEMSELRTILNMADEYSLVLGDELCSGTESDSALSIFTAGLELLHKKKSSFLFATHFHEINNYDEIKSLDRLKMMHMEVIYDREKDILIYDRKLKDGAGDSMYGLEVCKSLNLPSEFLQRAHDIRMKYNKKDLNILAEEGSHFNKKKLKGNCEICHKRGTEVHHLIHQNQASDKNDYIQTFHKNHQANLINICNDCHNEIHHSGKQHKMVKTTKGYSLSPVAL